jgi:hypothetical protein
MKKKGLYIVFIIMIVLLASPAIQMRLRLFREKPLNGAFHLSENPAFDKEKWISGEFQGQVENYLKDHAGFKNFLIRLQNQVDLVFFRKAHAEGAVVGKNMQLFEYDYIRSWLALDYPGDSFVQKKLQRTRFLQEYLKSEKGIDLVIVFEPGKASFYQEYIPRQFSGLKKGASTYEQYRTIAMGSGVEFIDFHQYFLQLKEKSEFPLYPRYGTHWSVYGMWYCTDSLLRFIEDRRKINLTDVSVDSVLISSEPFDTDDDILKTMNLLFPPGGQKLAYPSLSFDTANPGDKPMVLVIADSYYWNIFNTRVPKHLFANEAFWYFNSLVYPDHYVKPAYTSDLDLKTEVEKQDIIFLMVTERFIHKFDWRFIDQLYSLYAPEWLRDPVYEKINDIMQVETWYQRMIDKSSEKKTSLEDILITEGRYLFQREDTIAYLVHYGPWHYSRIIENDTGWMAYVEEKALKEKVSLEQMLNSHALFAFMKEYPEPYKLNRGMTAMEEWIYSDHAMLSKLTHEAGGYGFDQAAFIRIKAWQLFRDEEIGRTCQAIRNDAAWLEIVKEKARDNNIPLDEMIRMDAEYMWKVRVKDLRLPDYYF